MTLLERRVGINYEENVGLQTLFVRPLKVGEKVICSLLSRKTFVRETYIIMYTVSNSIV